MEGEAGMQKEYSAPQGAEKELTLEERALFDASIEKALLMSEHIASINASGFESYWGSVKASWGKSKAKEVLDAQQLIIDLKEAGEPIGKFLKERMRKVMDGGKGERLYDLFQVYVASGCSDSAFELELLAHPIVWNGNDRSLEVLLFDRLPGIGGEAAVAATLQFIENIVGTSGKFKEFSLNAGEAMLRELLPFEEVRARLGALAERNGAVAAWVGKNAEKLAADGITYYPHFASMREHISEPFDPVAERARIAAYEKELETMSDVVLETSSDSLSSLDDAEMGYGSWPKFKGSKESKELMEFEPAAGTKETKELDFVQKERYARWIEVAAEKYHAQFDLFGAEVTDADLEEMSFDEKETMLKALRLRLKFIEAGEPFAEVLRERIFAQIREEVGFKIKDYSYTLRLMFGDKSFL